MRRSKPQSLSNVAGAKRLVQLAAAFATFRRVHGAFCPQSQVPTFVRGNNPIRTRPAGTSGRKKRRCNGDSATRRGKGEPVIGLCGARQWGGLSLTPLYVILIGGASEATSGRASPGRRTVRQHLA